MARVSLRQRRIARRHGLVNVRAAARASARTGLPFSVACALLEKESGGRNVFGHDKGGVFSRDEFPAVTDLTYHMLLVRVMNGALSNGVGPCQITFAGSLKNGHRDGGYFRQMAEQSLRPWVPEENMIFGFSVLLGHFRAHKSWRIAGRLYNGRDSYGIDLVKRIEKYRAAGLT